MRLGRKCVDPEHVKSPHPPAAGTTSSSKAGSFKASFGSKTGFLSLLLCCTAGAAGSLVDDDKSTIFKQQRRPPSIQQRKQPPHINTDPVLLTGNETPVTSNTPLSSPNVCITTTRTILNALMVDVSSNNNRTKKAILQDCYHPWIVRMKEGNAWCLIWMRLWFIVHSR